METPTVSQPADALEQRIYDLLRPYRFEYLTNNLKPEEARLSIDQAVKCESKVFTLVQNIAFLVYNSEHNTERVIRAKDVFVVSRGWDGDGAADGGGVIAVLVRYPEVTYGIVKAQLKQGDDVVDSLIEKVDAQLAEMF